MACKAAMQDRSPDVISWQQNNCNRYATKAIFCDSVANSSMHALGHMGRDCVLFSLAGGAVAAAGSRTLTKTMGAAIAVTNDFRATRSIQTPILLQFEEGRLYNGFPVDAFKVQKPDTRSKN